MDVSKLPSTWDLIEIEESLLPYDNGKKIRQGWSPQCERFPAKTDGHWGVLKTSAIQDGAFIEEANKHLPEKLEPKEHLEVLSGDILMTCAGPRARCGVTCLVKSTRPKLLISGKMYQLRCDPSLMGNEFLEGYLREWNTKKLIDKMKTGISDSGLNLTHGRFKTLRIPLPPLNEQRRIVAKIEELFSEVDAGVASLKTARAQLGVYRQSLLKQAFEGKLTEQWRAQNPDKLEPAEQLLAGLKVEKATTCKAHSCDGWLTIQLGELTDYVTSGSRGWAAYYADSGSIFIRAQNLKTDWLNLNDIAYVKLPEKVEGLRTLTKKGDLLITITGANVTKTAYVDRDLNEAYVSQHVALCRLLDPALTEFLYLYIISPAGGRRDLEKAAYGAGKPGLNLTNIRELRVPLCSLPEQKEIVRILEEQFTAIEQNEAEIDAALQRAEALRQSILKKAFAGKLVPQDPNDEPASVLLERIRVEREAAEAALKAKKTVAKAAVKKRARRVARN